MRLLRSAFLLTVLVLALAAAGCGSDEAEVEEVPGAPVELTVPHQKGAADLSEDANATPTPTPSETPTPTADRRGRRHGAAGRDGGTDAAATGGTRRTPARGGTRGLADHRHPAPAGSAPEQFEQFCEENAGAC